MTPTMTNLTRPCLLRATHRRALDVLALGSRLRNRRVAMNVAEFADIRRPPLVDPDVWAVEVASRVLVGVPGAGPLDIEPLADEREGVVALVVFSLVSAAVLSLSVSALGDATGVWGVSLCDEVGTSGTFAYDQCVSDLFGG